MIEALFALASAVHGTPDEITTIAFGSCAREDREQAIWSVIGAHAPDLFLFIGDNVYADVPEVPRTAADIAAAYQVLAQHESWRAFTQVCPVLATWDDHDYGKNDAGVEWELKAESQQVFLDFFGVAEDSPRRGRLGVYHAEVFGPVGRRVQVILLDTRYHRDPLATVPRAERRPGRGPYRPRDVGTMLGDAQWAWLEEQLRKPAELRLIASSIQVVAGEHGWEGWMNLPHERRRLYDLIDRSGAAGVIFLSGDRHLIELSCDRSEAAAYPLWDFTSSGLNQARKDVEEPNRHRVGPVHRETNFGLIHIEWGAAGGPVLRLEGRNGRDELLLSQLIWLSTLRQDA